MSIDFSLQGNFLLSTGSFCCLHTYNVREFLISRKISTLIEKNIVRLTQDTIQTVIKSFKITFGSSSRLRRDDVLHPTRSTEGVKFSIWTVSVISQKEEKSERSLTVRPTNYLNFIPGYPDIWLPTILIEQGSVLIEKYKRYNTK